MKKVLIITLLATTLAFPALIQSSDTGHPGRYSLHLIQPGDTLSDLNNQYIPSVNLQQGIKWIQEANWLQEDYIPQPGDILNIPDPNGPLSEPLGPTYSSEEAAKKAEEEVQKLINEQEIPKSRGSQSVSRGQSRYLVMEATAYTAGPESTGKSPGHSEYGITQSGLPADAGTIAVDPDIIPIGSIVWVEGYGYALALDTGSAIEGYKIDVFFWDLETALKWGRKKVRVKIIDF